MPTIVDALKKKVGGTGQTITEVLKSNYGGSGQRIDDVISTMKASGGGSTGDNRSDVNFYDYDGTLIASFTADEFVNATSMPANPSHEGLVAQGWNWSFTDAKAYVAKYGKLEIGQMYTTDDGKTRFYVSIPNDIRSALSVTVTINASVVGGITVDWGDGVEETNQSNTQEWLRHTYSSAGDYLITFAVTSGTLTFVGITDDELGTIYPSFQPGRYLKKAFIGNDVDLSSAVFGNCYNLESITFPEGISAIGWLTFANCYSLKSITIPKPITEVPTEFCKSCSNLASVALPSSVLTINDIAFCACYKLRSLTIPSGVSNIANQLCYTCYGLESVTIPDSVHTVSEGAFRNSGLRTITIPSSTVRVKTNAFEGCNMLDSVIFLPTTPPTVDTSWITEKGDLPLLIVVPYSEDHTILDAYKIATNLSRYSNRMVEADPA